MSMRGIALLYLLIAMMLLATCAGAQVIIPEGAVTAGWNAPVVDVGGAPLLQEDLVSYRVYVEDMRTGVRTLLGETTAVEYAVVVPYRSTWRIGVSAVLDGNESAVAWSTVAADVDAGRTFLLRPKGAVAKPAGLRGQ